MNKTKSSFLIILALLLLVPSVTFASWWNPFSWKIFNRKAETKIEKTITNLTSQNTTEQKINDQSSEIEKLKKEVEELKNKSTNVSVAPKPKQQTPTIIERNNPTPTPTKETPPIVESWTTLENKNFAEADQKGLVTLIITNALGEKRYYRKEGVLWFRKNSETEMQQSYSIPPTTQQLTNLRRFCLADSKINTYCQNPIFMSSYYSNEKSRIAIDDLVRRYLEALSSNAQQKIASEKSTLACLMAPLPAEEIGLSPATQDYLMSMRCGTVTDADKTNYELSRIKSSVDELKYRLDSKTSFPSLYLDPIKTPTFDNTKWQVRWDGSGGRVTNSNGSSYQFHCENNVCRSY